MGLTSFIKGVNQTHSKRIVKIEIAERRHLSVNPAFFENNRKKGVL